MAGSCFEMPDEWKKVFVVAEAPYLEDGKLKVMVNQGPMGITKVEQSKAYLPQKTMA